MTGLTDGRVRQVLAWLVIGLLVVPVGGALWLGVAMGESPCILCWAQRTSMVLIALVGLFVVRYGPRPRYLGMIVLLGAWGVFMSFRHWSLHIARDIGQGFALDVLGVHTYVWSWFVHWAVLLVAAVLLLLVRGPLEARLDRETGRAGRFAMILLVALAGANAVQAFVSTGPPPFIGQADPVRLSLNPGNWIWSLDELAGSVSLRGSWAVPEPDPAAVEVDEDPAAGPLADLPALAVLRTVRIPEAVEGRVTGLATAPSHRGGADEGNGDSAAPTADLTAPQPSPSAPTGPVLVTTDDFGVYLLDADMSGVLHRVVLDPGFSVHLTPLAGATVLGGDTVAVLATNKSYVLLKPDSAADPGREWRHFRETDGGVRELRRSRFGTVRAREQWVLCLAFDATAREYVTVSVPSPRQRRLVVSRFDAADRILSSEFLPEPGPALTLRPDRALAEYVVTGAAVADGTLYAISAAYSTLLVIDLSSETVTAAFAVPGIEQPAGLAVQGEELWVAQADGRVIVLERPL